MDVVATEAAPAWPSACGKAVPRIGSQPDKRCHLARDIAVEMFPTAWCTGFIRAMQDAPGPRVDRGDIPERRRGPQAQDDDTKARRLAYQRFTQALSVLTTALAAADGARPLPRVDLATREYTPEVLAEKLRAPIAREVLDPEPVPVTPCALDELDGLFAHLQADLPVKRQTPFARGTLMPDGRLDLCKQVVGPAGIAPLLDAMGHSRQVKRLLLGNNIVGDGGAEAIARFIRARQDSPLDCWYIAGNHFTAEGIRPVCEALADDRRVRALWLKRNPLRAAGMAPLAEMLRRNQTLEVLDLVNCGLLDEGLETLLGALRGPGANKTLRHLYVGTNGVTARSAAALADYIAGDCALESLYLSCNRLGDEGVEAIAPALAVNRTLRRVSFASNRIGPRGAAALARALAENTSIALLDLGFTKATVAVGELGNLLGDDGAHAMAWLLERNGTLRVLDLLHNYISQRGVNAIRSALARNTSLVSLQLTQFGRVHNEPGREEVKALLARNRAALTPSALDDARRLELPDHIAEIYSVYRTHV